jgi:hypothetical protein
MGYLLAIAASLALLPATSRQSLSQSRDALKPEVLITTMTPAEIAKAGTADLEHDTEVARSESLTIVVGIATCEKNEAGSCNASADVVAYKPDGTVHSEVKNLALGGRRATAPLQLESSDATGLYKVVATIRDLNARRFGTAERFFGVK